MIASPRLLCFLFAGTIASHTTAQDEPWSRMDYGPFVSISVGLGEGLMPVHKGIVVRLRTPDGDPTDLRAVFDTDLLAWRCVWPGEIWLRGIVYDGPHGVFPEIDGDPMFRTAPLPGVIAGDGAEDPREEPWGPVPATLARWSGLHLDGDDVVFEYTALGRHRVLERVWAQPHGDGHAFVREVTVETDGAVAEGPTLRVIDSPNDAVVNGAGATLRTPGNGTVRVAIAAPGSPSPAASAAPSASVHQAISRSRPRWGEPLVTRGIVGDTLESGTAARRIQHRAGDEAKSINLAAADGGRIELVRDGVAVESGPATELVVLRTLPIPPERPYQEGDQIGWWPSDAGSGTHEQNAFTGAADLRLDGVTWRRGVVGRSLDFDGTAAAWPDVEIDHAEHDLTVASWIHTTSDGTVFAISPPQGEWTPDGASLFLRQGRLTFDVGWVGAVSGGPRIDDGSWHHVAAIWRSRRGAVRLFVDGERVAAGRLSLEGEDTSAFQARFGWTNENFPAISRFSGYMDGPILLRRAIADDAILAIAAQTGEALATATVVRWNAAADRRGPTLRLDGPVDNRVARLEIPPVSSDVTYDVRNWRGPRSVALARASESANDEGLPAQPFRIDRITWPDDNPHGSWLRFGGLQMVGDTGAILTTWSGDVWRVDGLDEDLDELQWTRVATGLNQPFGVAQVDGEILVLGREQITRIVDRNGDGEADFLENVTNSGKNSEHFHEPASGLLVEPDGSMVYIKAARHAKYALHDHHGAVLRVKPDGTTQVVARGFRAPIGLTRLPDGSLLASDQEGHWTPANRINLIRPSSPPGFYGNGWAARTDVGERIRRGGEMVQPAWDLDGPFVPPLTWIHPSVDRSPSSQVYLDHAAWGPLEGSILGLSYGTGDVYLILRDDVATGEGSTVTQGGIVKLGLQFPTGLLTGRIHAQTGDLYVCGLYGWSSDRTDPGGFFRIRPDAEEWPRSLNVPHRMRALSDGLELTFLHPLDRSSATDATLWRTTAWNYLRTPDYGSATYSLDGARDARTAWIVRDASLSADGRTVRLRIADFQPAMQVHVSWNIADATGRPLSHEAHLTVHAVH